MAKAIPWIERIGQQRILQLKNGKEIVVTLWDVIIGENTCKKNLHVEAEGKIYKNITTRNWSDGKLTVITKDVEVEELRKKYVGQVKLLAGHLVECINYNHDTKKVEVVIDGADGTYEAGIDSWHGKCQNLVNLINKLFGSVKKVVKKITEKGKKTVKKAKEILDEITTKPVRYELMIVSEKPITGEIITKHINDLRGKVHYKEFKQAYKKLANIFHPDKGGNVELFDIITNIYKVQGDVLKRCESLLMAKVTDNDKYEQYKKTMKCIIDARFAREELHRYGL